MATYWQIRKFSNGNMLFYFKSFPAEICLVVKEFHKMWVPFFLLKTDDVWRMTMRTYWHTKRYGSILFYFKYKSFQISGVARDSKPRNIKKKNSTKKKVKKEEEELFSTFNVREFQLSVAKKMSEEEEEFSSVAKKMSENFLSQ